MLDNLPRSYEAVKTWNWSDFAPFYQELLEADLTAANLDDWMRAATRFYELLMETYSRLNVAHTCDTTDETAEQQYNAFIEGVMPFAMQAGNEINRKLIESGLQPDNYEVPLLKARTQVEIFREANLPLMVEEQKLGMEYDKISGAQTVEWEGEEVTLIKLQQVLQDTDREKRQAAWRLMMDRWLQDREALNALWVKFLDVRQQMAKNAGFDSYRDLRWKQFNRFDYTPADAQTFRDAIEQVVVPAARRLYEKRQQQLGVDSLRPWDLDVDADNRDALRPFTDIDDLNQKTAAIFEKVDPKLGGYYRTMLDQNLLDLDNRKGKAPGGYCTSFDVERVPFIFMNAVGKHDDVQTLLHEGGHSFHVFETAALPYFGQGDYPIEFAEVASMAMELLAAPYLAASEGGFYSEADAARARIEHLEGIIRFWPYMAVVDGFQHWVYDNIEDARDADKCDAKWAELWDRFMQGIDFSGLEDEKETGWHRKLHIFQIPFYYIEYGLAQLGSVQVWGQSLKDQAAAVASYRKALALGGTAPLPELYSTAGAKFAFDADTLQQAVDLIEQTINDLEPIAAGQANV